MIIDIAGIILLLIIVLCFIDIRFGAAFFLVYTLLVPISDITLGPLHLGENLVKTLLILAIIFDFKIRHHYKFSWKLIVPFILYYVVELVIIPFQNETPANWMYNSWRVSMMSTLFGTFVIYNVLSHYPRSIKLFRNSLLISITVAGLYGLFLTTTGGVNPYIMGIALLTKSADVDYLSNYFAVSDRLFGRISSVFMHPMSFGLFLGLSFIYVYSIRLKIKKLPLISILVILALDSLFCGVRSVIGGLVIAISFYLLFSRNLKVALSTLVIGLVAYNIILTMPELSSYLSSITDIHNTQTDVGGSSIELRMDQLRGCIYEIRNCPIIGKGFDWDAYYTQNFGGHPDILYFESLIFVILCDNGIFGFVIWGCLIAMILRQNHKFKIKDVYVADAMLVFYIAYACITGEYGYMQYFLLFYICLIFENLESGKKEVPQEKKCIGRNKIV